MENKIQPDHIGNETRWVTYWTRWTTCGLLQHNLASRIELSSFGLEHVRTHPENMMSFGSLEIVGNGHQCKTRLKAQIRSLDMALAVAYLTFSWATTYICLFWWFRVCLPWISGFVTLVQPS
jgi:hypothetical protein